MRIGKLRHRVTLQSAVDSQESTGAPETTWRDIATVYAEIRPLKGREALIGDGLLAEVDTLITIRWAPYLASLTPKSRVVHQAAGRPVTYYNIVSNIEPDMARGMLDLNCKSGTNEG